MTRPLSSCETDNERHLHDSLPLYECEPNKWPQYRVIAKCQLGVVQLVMHPTAKIITTVTSVTAVSWWSFHRGILNPQAFAEWRPARFHRNIDPITSPKTNIDN